MSDAVFVLEKGDGPIVATAIHAGHALHPEIAALIALDEAIRMREEDPFTAQSGAGGTDPIDRAALTLRDRP